MQDVIHAAYSAFHSWLHAALLVSAALMFTAGLFTFIVARHRNQPSGREARHRG